MFNKQQLANEAAVAAMAEPDIEDLKPSDAERALGSYEKDRPAAAHLNNQKAWRR